MMGWTSQPKSKKALKEEAVGKAPKFLETSFHGLEYQGDGTYYVVGPCPYTSRKWYAEVVVAGGVVTKVK